MSRRTGALSERTSAEVGNAALLRLVRQPFGQRAADGRTLVVR